MVLGAVFCQDDRIVIDTPKGIRLELEAQVTMQGESWASCAVRKDGGDDPDVTNGTLIYAKVTKKTGSGITLDGGIGVGRVHKRGLACAVGEAAINPVPRQMILEQVRSVCEEFDYRGGLDVEISVPEGEEIARRTFNAQLGILGGISILGTSGIVEPMSEQALIDTIKVKMNVRKADGTEYLIITPGNYGETFLKSHIVLPDIDAVKCSNFFGEALDYAEHAEFRGVLLVGHLGKLIKVAAGIMNTHSRYGDARMEILGYHAARAGAPKALLERLAECVTTEDAIDVLAEEGIREETIQSVLKRLDERIRERVHHSMEIGAILFTNKHGYLGETASAPLLRQKLLEQERKGKAEQ
jgi:cobalt-precorrin-5B (C1)-methyltransferase